MVRRRPRLRTAQWVALSKYLAMALFHCREWPEGPIMTETFLHSGRVSLITVRLKESRRQGKRGMSTVLDILSLSPDMAAYSRK
eukprot:7620873-Heterocapsa_arctica.AAC.1